MQESRDIVSCVPSEKNATLIEEVKKFPALYDTRDPDYYMLAQRNKAWLEVAQNCGEPADLCHLRWKSLRKRFAKEKRRFPEILQGQRRPWALFPKMAFLAPVPTTVSRKDALKAKFQKSTPPSDNDMLIINDKDEIVGRCKTEDVNEEEDEYIYETLDDPDSFAEMIKAKPPSGVKPKAIRSGVPLRRTVPTAPSRIRGSGRIRKVTPKMQNSIIAKKLKQAQTYLGSSVHPPASRTSKNLAGQKVYILNKTPINKPAAEQSGVATVRPNVREEMKEGKPLENIDTNNSTNNSLLESPKSPGGDEKKSFKVFKLKGRNPVIFSPDQLPEIQEFLKSESAATPNKDPQNSAQTPALKIRSVDTLNQTPPNLAGVFEPSNNNLDIIHSVGLVRKNSVQKPTNSVKYSHQSFTRAYSWNRPGAKQARKAKQTVEKIQPQPDSQTNDYEIEESWNDIKQENIEEDFWSQPQDSSSSYLPHEPMVMLDTPDTPANRNHLLTKVNEAKLELISYQRKLLEEQHNKTLEYMKKEHDLKMAVLRAEIDLKRKQLSILL